MRRLNIIGNLNTIGRRGSLFPTADLTCLLTMAAYESEGTTYYTNSKGADIPVVSGTGLDTILDFSVLSDVRLDKSNATYWGSSLGDWFYYDASNPYHAKLQDFYYPYFQNQMASENNYAFLNTDYDNIGYGYNCLSTGKAYAPQTVAYGDIEFEITTQGGTVNNFVSIMSTETDYATGNGYYFNFQTGNGTIAFYRRDGASPGSLLFITNTGYIANNTKYKVKVERSETGRFEVFIKWGAFGDNYVSVDITGGSGANPRTDNTYTTSLYFGLNITTGFELKNIYTDNELLNTFFFTEVSGSFVVNPIESLVSLKKLLIYSTQQFGNDLVQLLNYIDYDFFDTIPNIVTVGSGKDYADIPSALTGITDAAITKLYRIDVYDDIVITDKSDFTNDDVIFYRYIISKEYIFLNGVGTQKRVDCSIPNTATDTETTFYEPALFNTNMCGVKNMHFTMKNGRYASHMDGLNNNSIMYFNKCKFEHLGNQEVIDYRIANSQAYSGVFAGKRGVGIGTNSGVKIYFNNSIIEGIAGMYIHNNTSFSIKHFLQFNKCQFISSGIYNTKDNPLSELQDCLLLDCLNSDLINTDEHNTCTFNSYINYRGRVYDTGLPSGISYILADIDLTGKDNNSTELAFVDVFGGSLFVESNTPTIGTVSIIGGTAESVIMPNSEIFELGALGKMEVGEWSRNTAMALGSRLGDLSVTSKDLQVSVDGGGTQTITFDEDFTSQDNDTILTFINNQLIGAVVSLYQRVQDYTPNWD